jgi:hypothetical protein
VSLEEKEIRSQQTSKIYSDKRGGILCCVKAFAKTVSTAGDFEVWLNAIDDVNSTETKDDKSCEH